LVRIRVRILYALARSLVLFVTLIFTQLINAIFKIYRILLEKLRPKGGFLFSYIRRYRLGGKGRESIPTGRLVRVDK
jgi:hypothetical protein